jgi:uncharacterized cofD-like protein
VKVVALGGGHGLSATLRAVRRYADDVCAIVSVADDGGSSGRLRQALGMPAPGDLRMCLVALAEPESLWTRAFEHRFEGGELEGHAFGNLVIAGLTDATGDFGVALEAAGKLLGVAGQVLPATREPVVLKAEAEGVLVEGQTAVKKVGGISGVSLVPADPEPPAAALAALDAADQIVIGPGSLFTSVLAVVAVPALRGALASTRGRKVYVCNLREQRPETAGFDVADHVDALRVHGLEVDVVLYDPSGLPRGHLDVPFVEASIARYDGLAHAPDKLARALEGLVG